MNASYPAPVAVRGMGLKRIEDVVLGAMAKMLPDRMTAGHSGQYSMIFLSGDDGTGRRVQGLAGGPYAGGHGARPNSDGIDCTEHGVTNGSGFPVEVSEAQLPLLFRRVELWPDSGGAGTWRGGLGFTTELEWRGGEANVRFRRERHKFTPWGVQGGLRSLPCTTELRRPDGSVLRLSGKARMPLAHGDVIRVFTTGSGGYGLPIERDPERVRADVRDRKVSPQAAYELYGVVMNGDQVDLDATRRLRAELRTRAAGALAPGERGAS